MAQYKQNFTSSENPQESTFNAELFHRHSTLECLLDYLRVKQVKDFDGMFELLDSITDHNYAQIETTEIDKMLDWLRINKDRWCVKDETGTVTRINPQNKLELEKMFKKTHRALIQQLFAHGIIHRNRDDPKKAMARFES